MIKKYELTAFVIHGLSKKSFYLSISNSKQSEDADDFYCDVHAPILFDKDKKIFGIDEKQAFDLALRFVKKAIQEKQLKLVDKNGVDINLLALGS